MRPRPDLSRFGVVEPQADAEAEAVAIGDVARVRALLVAAARMREPLSYSDILARMGHRFSRPKMRALCRTLDEIDRVGRGAGEPALAVLVVRESDRLPGQGWWIGRDPPWTGSAAQALVAELQAAAFDYWADPRRAVP